MNGKIVIAIIVALAVIGGVIALIFIPGGKDAADEEKSLDGVTLTDASFTYDGEAKSIAVKDLPDDARVTYIGGNSYTDVGVYTVTALVSGKGYKSVTLTATLTITAPPTVLYTVSFDTDGGGVIEATTVEGGNLITAPTKPQKPGHTFSGWYNGDVEFKFNNDTVNEDITLKALWTPTVYTVTYILLGGVNHRDNPTSISILDGTLPLYEPTREEYLFHGWYTDSRFPESKRVDSLSVENFSDITLYAKWTPISHTVTFDSNGGSAVAPIIVEDSYTAKMPDAPKKKGYEFVSWQRNGVDWSFTSDRVTEDITLVAVWRLAEYKITYHANGGDFEEAPVSTYTMLSDRLALPCPIRIGYKFDGWYTNEAMTSTKRIEAIESGSVEDLDLYAKWSSISYSITYDTAGGELPGGYIYAYTVEEQDIPLPTPVRHGYKFTGWQNTNASSSAPLTCIEAGTVGNLSLRASWERYYTVTLVSPRGYFIGGITVSLLDSDGKVVATAVSSSSNGLAEFKDITEGSYTIRLSKNGEDIPVSESYKSITNSDPFAICIEIT